MPESRPGASAEAYQRPQPCSILVVEDETSVRALIADYLRQEGYRVEEAEDGAAAVHLLQRHRAVGAPLGLVLLDLMLPLMSGLDVLGYVPALAAHVPVVAITAHDELTLAALAARARSVLRKPFDLDQLLASVARYCEPESGHCS